MGLDTGLEILQKTRHATIRLVVDGFNYKGQCGRITNAWLPAHLLDEEIMNLYNLLFGKFFHRSQAFNETFKVFKLPTSNVLALGSK